MDTQLSYARPLYWILLLFAATAVASIALQNILIWPAVLLFLAAHYRDKLKINWPSGIFPWATLLFLLTYFWGAVIGIDPANSFHTVHKYLTLLLIFPLGAMALSSQEIRNYLTAYTYGAAFCALAGIGKHFFLHEDRISSFSGDKMVFGGMLMAALLFQLLLLKESPRQPLHWVSLALLGWALVLTETRGAWVGSLIGFVFLMWRFGKKWLFIGLVILAASFFFMPPSLQQRVKSIGGVSFGFQNHEIGNSNETRILIWDAGVKIIRDYPWGVGQGNVEKIYPKYRSQYMSLEPTVPHLHDNFLQLTAQNGWIGLLAYLLWIFSYYWTARRFKPTDLHSVNLNWAFLCVFTGVLVWGLTEYTFSHQFMNVQFFLLGLQVSLWTTSIRKPVADQGD